MIVVTVATGSVGYFPNLTEQCERLGLNLKVLGFGNKWQGFQWRFQLMREYLRTLPPREVVVFVDGYDVLPLRGEEAILAAFRRAHTPILLSVEHRASFLTWWLYRKTFGNCRGLQLNAGMYMGYASALLQLYDEICDITDCAVLNQDDQSLLSRLCNVSQEQAGSFFNTHVKFDVDSEVFMNLSSANWHDINWHENALFRIDEEDGHHRLVQRQTGREPAFLHGPGNIDMRFAVKLYGMRDLGLVVENRGDAKYYWNGFSLYAKHFRSELIAGALLITVIISFVVYLVVRWRANRAAAAAAALRDNDNE